MNNDLSNGNMKNKLEFNKENGMNVNSKNGLNLLNSPNSINGKSKKEINLTSSLNGYPNNYGYYMANSSVFSKLGSNIINSNSNGMSGFAIASKNIESNKKILKPKNNLINFNNKIDFNSNASLNNSKDNLYLFKRQNENGIVTIKNNNQSENQINTYNHDKKEEAKFLINEQDKSTNEGINGSNNLICCPENTLKLHLNLWDCLLEMEQVNKNNKI